MKRQSLVLTSIGGAAVLATIGATLGAVAADDRPLRATPVAIGTPTTAASPDDSATTALPDDTATPDDSATTGTPDDSATTGTPDNSATNGTPDDSATTATPEDSATSGPPNGTVDQRRAGEIALAEVDSGRIVRIEAEWEHGRAVWDVKILAGGVEHKVDVDRETGAVLRYEQDDADDDRHRDDDRDDHDGPDDHDDHDDHDHD